MQSTRLAKGGAVAEKSFVVLVLVGIAEVFIKIFYLSLLEQALEHWSDRFYCWNNNRLLRFHRGILGHKGIFASPDGRVPMPRHPLRHREHCKKCQERERSARHIRMRKLGPYLVGDMHIVVDGEMSVREADQIAIQIEKQVKEEFDEVTELKVRIEPPKPSSKK